MSPSQVTLTVNSAPPVMMGLPLASCAAMRNEQTWPASADVSPEPLAWQQPSAT